MSVYFPTRPVSDFASMHSIVTSQSANGSTTSILAKDEPTNPHLGTFSELGDAVKAAKMITGPWDWGGSHPGVAIMDAGSGAKHVYSLHQLARVSNDLGGATPSEVDGDVSFEFPTTFDRMFTGPVTHVDPQLAALVDGIAYTPSVEPDGTVRFVYTEAFGYGPGKVAKPQVPGQ